MENQQQSRDSKSRPGMDIRPASQPSSSHPTPQATQAARKLHDDTPFNEAGSGAQQRNHVRLTRWYSLRKKKRGSSSGKRVVKKRLLVGIVLLLITVGTITTLAATRNKKPSPPPEATPSELIENLEYQTIVPKGRVIGDLGGWKRVSPPENDPVYAYTDSIGDVAISVSQQPVPGAFIGDLDNRVTKLAKEYNATTLIYADGIKVYIGTSSKGPQSTIFTKNNLLILIKSQKKIDEQAWVQYIRSLN